MKLLIYWGIHLALCFRLCHAFAMEAPKRPFKVSIEGNISAGKSTFIKYFNNSSEIEIYGEPIEQWRNVNGHNLLDLMYSNINEWLNVFQNYVQLTRLKNQISPPKHPDISVQIFERSLQNNRFCFVELAHKNGLLTDPEYAVLDQWYQWIDGNYNISLDLIVYLRTTPTVAYDRMKKRNRTEENQVSLEYLEDLHLSHEKWLIQRHGLENNVPVLVLDADQSIEGIYQQFQNHEMGKKLKENSRITG